MDWLTIGFVALLLLGELWASLPIRREGARDAGEHLRL